MTDWYSKLNLAIRYAGSDAGHQAMVEVQQGLRELEQLRAQRMPFAVTEDEMSQAWHDTHCRDGQELTREALNAILANRIASLRDEQAEAQTVLQKHQDLVEALKWLPAGTVVNFCDLDDFLDEVREPTEWHPGWLPRRECKHASVVDDRCERCGAEDDELAPPPEKPTEGGSP